VTSDTEGIQHVKAARNQALWREINERIKIVAETSCEIDFVCECAKTDCIETVAMTTQEYERIRSSPTRFPVVVGHEFLEFESVVELSDGYAVVQKKGAAAEEAARLDPRSNV
jgi:5-bromo-4-chloroindolyl phosphate hydrolysis protein